VYVYSEMLALFASDRYDASLSDLSNLAAHLTNTCRQTDAAVGEDSAAGLDRACTAAAAGPASELPDTPYRAAQQSTSRSAGCSSYSEADVIRLLSELPEVRPPRTPCGLQ
jgi:Tubulin-tyrosine ligase family